MYNLYFKLEDPKKQNVYIRTMQYMITVNSEGREVVEFYDPEKFILVDDYFRSNPTPSLTLDEEIEVVQRILNQKLGIMSEEKSSIVKNNIKKLEKMKINKSGK